MGKEEGVTMLGRVWKAFHTEVTLKLGLEG